MLVEIGIAIYGTFPCDRGCPQGKGQPFIVVVECGETKAGGEGGCVIRA